MSFWTSLMLLLLLLSSRFYCQLPKWCVPGAGVLNWEIEWDKANCLYTCDWLSLDGGKFVTFNWKFVQNTFASTIPTKHKHVYVSIATKMTAVTATTATESREMCLQYASCAQYAVGLSNCNRFAIICAQHTHIHSTWSINPFSLSWVLLISGLTSGSKTNIHSNRLLHIFALRHFFLVEPFLNNTLTIIVWDCPTNFVGSLNYYVYVFLFFQEIHD